MSVLLIWVVTGVLVYMAVQRVMSPNYEINATVMLITAAVGVVVNVMYVVSMDWSANLDLCARSVSTDHNDLCI